VCRLQRDHGGGERVVLEKKARRVAASAKGGKPSVSALAWSGLWAAGSEVWWAQSSAGAWARDWAAESIFASAWAKAPETAAATA
jgi:hypothetical protein